MLALNQRLITAPGHRAEGGGRVSAGGQGERILPRDVEMVAPHLVGDVGWPAADRLEVLLGWVREEERGRLRRDRHEGVGSSLAGLSMQVRAAKELLPRHSPAGKILATVAEDLRRCAV